MKYSLLSQFKGALLGAIIGDFIGKELNIVTASKREKRKSLQGLEKKRASNGEIAIISARSLIRCEGLELEDWQENWKKWQRKQLAEDLHKGAIVKPASEQTSSRGYAEAMAWETAVASLPAAMLYHEEENKLRKKLDQIAEVGRGNLDVKLNNLAFGYAIAMGLQEKLDPESAIPKTISYLKEEGPLVELLEEVKMALEKRADLETAITKLTNKAKAMKQILSDLGEESKEKEKEKKGFPSPTLSLMPMPLAFYCFLSSPENWELSVLRAARTGQGHQICAIVGALSGAYNSIAGIPIEWRRALNATLEKTQTMAEVATGETEIIKLATSLWALWCGVYNPETIERKLNLVPAVAASNVIRPRLS